MTHTTTPTALPQTAGLYVRDYGQTDDPQQPLAFPLQHTDVKAQISGNLSRIEVIQTFENPFTSALEATYVFPLPDEAAVDTMMIRLGDRTIQGRIEQREEAQAIYEQAKQRGQTAGLLEQERANIFTQSLANIRPGEQIEVVIGYSDRLAYKQGSYEFVFPMVVGPRYIPGHPIAGSGPSQGSAPMTPNQDTDLVPDARRLNAPILPEGMRSGHDIQVTVEIETGLGSDSLQISDLRSPSHQIQVDTQASCIRITLAPSDTLPNKDLILRYQVAGDTTHTSLLTQSDERGGHFALYLIPAISYDTEQYIPKDMVFLIDTSGSQSGPPLAQCQALMQRFIEGLHPQDTFNIVNFANTTQQLSKVSLQNTPSHRKQALDYVNRLQASGGTQMLRGLKTVLNLPQMDTDRIRNVVLLTDGYIGNETQIFAEVEKTLTRSTRLHSFGAGSSVNRFLLNRIAEFGRGISHIVRHDEPIDAVVDQFFGQINNPVLGNLSLQWDGAGAAPDLYPMAPPDLFAEQPLMVLGRKTDRQPGTLKITGIAANGERFEQPFAVSFKPSGNPAIAQLWGRARLKELMNQMVSGETTRGVEAVTQTALAYQLLSQYTAFVAVSDEVRVEQPNESLSVNVPVNMPEAVNYEGIFGAVASAQPMMARRARPQMRVPAAPPSLTSQPIEDEFEFSQPIEDEFEFEAVMSEESPPMSAPTPAPASAPMPAASYRVSARGFATGDVDRTSSGKSYDMLDEFDDDEGIDVTFASPPTPAPQPGPRQIQIVKAEGLNAEALEQLQQHLQTVQMVISETGIVVFELVIQKGWVKRVMLDEEASAFCEPTIIEYIRRALLTWHCPQPIAKPVRLEIRVHA